MGLVVRKNYALDFTNQLRYVLMELESDDSGLTYANILRLF